MSPIFVTILGSTGSIGQNTLDVIARHPDRFAIHALTAHSRMDLLAQQAFNSKATVVAVPSQTMAERFKAAWGDAPGRPEIHVGAQALVEVARDPASQSVMAAIVGSAGLPAALAAAQAGKRVLLANKEALVAAGSIFMAAVHE
ncbi:MAG: 1-deoxy-D-xylulose-5-phosphate reductoisomerase, partial [Alcaligenaceae bacterium]